MESGGDMLPMNRNPYFVVAFIVALYILFQPGAFAADEVPCLVFTGSSDTPVYLDLSDYTRIHVDPTGMTVSSPSNPSAGDVELNYSEHHRFRIGTGMPTDFSSIEADGVSGDARLIFSGAAKTLRIESSGERSYNVGVYDLTGLLKATTTLKVGQDLSVAALPAGAYIAAAANQDSRLILKFIVK